VLRELFRDPRSLEIKDAPKQPSVAGFQTAAVTAFAPRDNVQGVANGAALSLKALRQELEAAGKAGRGGVFDAASKKKGGEVIKAAREAIQIGFGGAESPKRLMIAADADLWLAPFATAAETSGDLLLTNHEKGKKTFTLSFSVNDGDADEAIVTLAVCVLSRDRQEGPVTLTVQFNTGESVSQTRHLPAGGGKANTLYSFAAGQGQSIVALKVEAGDFTGDYVLLDDLAFITNGEAKLERKVARPKEPAVVPSSLPPEQVAKRRLTAFLERAFRRPATEEELERYFGLFQRFAKDATFEAGMKAAVRGILSSPSFLHRVEPFDPKQPRIRPLDSFEIASRLSYFLWATMPDEELFALARANKLIDPAIREAQLKRMLKDPKVRELSESFAIQWLRLNELWSARPDRKQFPAFYSGPQGKDTLAVALLIEPLLLFETVLVEDRSIVDLVDPKDGYLNPRLMKLYGYDQKADEWIKKLEAEGLQEPGARRNLVKSPNTTWLRFDFPSRERGGVLTMSGPLTLTSLPNRTSPVKRGAWVLEAIFNRPPPPPNVMVDPLEKVEAGDKPLTVRQRLETHRANANCAACHARIDPPGFALEGFDPIGAARTMDGGAPVDAKGRLADGRSFDGPSEFKDAILKKKDDFARGFIEHVLSYALGRELTYADAMTVKRILTAVRADDYRMSAVIREIVRSEAFHQVRNEEDDQP
jgi:hypothetical protein